MYINSSNCPSPCNSCGNCSCSCPSASYETQGCLNIDSTDCTQWQDVDIPLVGIKKGDSLTKMIKSIVNYITNAFTKISSNSLAVTNTTNSQIQIELIPSTSAGNILSLGADGRPFVPKTDLNLIAGSCFSWQKTTNGQNITYVPMIDWICVSQQVCGNCPSTGGGGGGGSTPPCDAPTGLVVIGTAQTSATLNWNMVAGVTYDALVNNVIQTSNIVSPYQFTSLLADTTYSLSIRAKCATGLTADTAASVTTLPVTSCNTPSSLAVTVLGGTASLTWVPGGGGGGQQVLYKLRTDSTYTIYSTVSPSSNSESIPGLQVNVLYDFKVINNCAGGVPTEISASRLEIGCPGPVVNSADVSVAVQFSTLGGSIDSYTVDLLDSTGAVILQSQTFTGPFSSTISLSFTSLSPSTGYNLRIKPGAQGTIKTDCPLRAFTTTSAAACPPPTNLTLNLS